MTHPRVRTCSGACVWVLQLMGWGVRGRGAHRDTRAALVLPYTGAQLGAQVRCPRAVEQVQHVPVVRERAQPRLEVAHEGGSAPTQRPTMRCETRTSMSQRGLHRPRRQRWCKRAHATAELTTPPKQDTNCTTRELTVTRLNFYPTVRAAWKRGEQHQGSRSPDKRVVLEHQNQVPVVGQHQQHQADVRQRRAHLEALLERVAQ